jgi:hypothetical protein
MENKIAVLKKKKKKLARITVSLPAKVQGLPN